MRFLGLGRIPLAGILIGFCTMATMGMASADTPGYHPAYIHGLRDLREAHALLDHAGNHNVEIQERRALADIDTAYRFAERAAEADHKDIHEHVPIDANLRHRDRLVKAISALQAARHDFGERESDRAALGWRRQALKWVNRALIHANLALHDSRSWDQGY